MRSARRTRDVPVFTHRSLGGGGIRLYPCDLAVAIPRHFTTAPSAACHLPAQEFPGPSSCHRRTSRRAGAHRSRPRSARFRAGGTLRGVLTPVPHVCLSAALAGPAPSGSSDTSRLVGAACHLTRHRPGPASASFITRPRQGEGEGLPPPLDQQAPHGARATRATGQRLHQAARPTVSGASALAAWPERRLSPVR